MAYWLLKSEPQVYGIEDLEREGRAIWDGVRNYQARNYLMQMKEGDLCFFYHSGTTPGDRRALPGGAHPPPRPHPV